MNNQASITIRNQFKKQTTNAIISIIFFIVIYLLLIAFSVGLTIGGVYLGIMIIVVAPSIITVLIGIGLASLGVLVFLFLLKFLLSTQKIDRSHLQEISAKDEPELFAMIEEIVKKVETDFPKKVYLSSDVNACVFYDSSFWSMFFPSKKNLQIGLGLVNTISKSELKAILSHEFGHFSQKSMKLGSYVYQVNQVIHNLLYQNDGYEKLIHKWSSGNEFIAFFVRLAVWIINAIQWILQKMYEIVNKSYMGVSREMEFHADEVAASITGIEPIKSSLLRMSLADASFNSVLSFYEGKIFHNLKSSNLYKEQEFVLQFLSSQEKFPMKNGLPYIPLALSKEYDKSKLVIDNQWASHPSIEDRIERLEQLQLPNVELDHSQAKHVFKQYDKWEIERTESLFQEIKFKQAPTKLAFESFEKEFRQDFKKNTFPSIYNGYYNEHNPSKVDFSTATSNDRVSNDVESLFSNQRKEVVDKLVALESDQQIIQQIADKLIPIRTFDYDGKKYKNKEAKSLLKKIDKSIHQLKESINKFDQEIFCFFRNLEVNRKGTHELKNHYSKFYEYDDQLNEYLELYKDFSESMQFIQYTTTIEEIHQNFKALRPKEKKLKKYLSQFIEESLIQTEITPEIKENIELYLSKEWQYFGNVMYFDKNVEMLHIAIQNFMYLASRKYFLIKKELLNFQAELTSNV